MTNKALKRYRASQSQDERNQIEQYVASIDDILTRRIFELRYIEGEHMPTWRDVAQRIGGGNSEDGVRRRAGRWNKIAVT